jgi:hypothetical protein
MISFLFFFFFFLVIELICILFCSVSVCCLFIYFIYFSCLLYYCLLYSLFYDFILFYFSLLFVFFFGLFIYFASVFFILVKRCSIILLQSTPDEVNVDGLRRKMSKIEGQISSSILFCVIGFTLLILSLFDSAFSQ